MKTIDATTAGREGNGGGQMELILAPETPEPVPMPVRPRPPRRPGRMGGAARWWFARMRDAVRTARDWEGAGASWGQEEQADLPLPVPAPVRFERRVPGRALAA